MLAALRADSDAAVRGVLDDDPLAACRPVGGSQDYPIVVALRVGASPKVIGTLLERGAEVKLAGAEDGRTPLEMVAASKPLASTLRARSMSALAIYGAKPAVERLHGMEEFQMSLFAPSGREGEIGPIALSMASEDRKIEYATWLLRYGADPHRVDAAGLSCAEAAAMNDAPRLAEFLRSWGGAEARAFRRFAEMSRRKQSETSERRGGSGLKVDRPSLLDLPEEALGAICDMLAPTVGSFQKEAHVNEESRARNAGQVQGPGM